jgi:hypothetical protein
LKDLAAGCFEALGIFTLVFIGPKKSSHRANLAVVGCKRYAKQAINSHNA